MNIENSLANNVGEWGLSLRLKFTTTDPVDLDYLGTVEGVKVPVGERVCCKYDIPVDDQSPERPCSTILWVTTYTDTQDVVRTDIEVDPNCFYNRDDPILLLCRILKIEPGSIRASEVHISDGLKSSTLESPDLNDSLFAFPNGFLLEKST